MQSSKASIVLRTVPCDYRGLPSLPYLLPNSSGDGLWSRFCLFFITIGRYQKISYFIDRHAAPDDVVMFFWKSRWWTYMNPDRPEILEPHSPIPQRIVYFYAIEDADCADTVPQTGPHGLTKYRSPQALTPVHITSKPHKT